jgi:hypothetical protein
MIGKAVFFMNFICLFDLIWNVISENGFSQGYKYFQLVF